ncbi:MAG: hypothetical protein IIU55_09330 [Paludibacteraceae bacterium]|nr:hypothetical protein [Paludibacteraceae bacterium]
MKKIFSLFLAMTAMVAVNAATYNMVGEFNGWANGSAPAFTEVSAGNYEITIPDFWGEAKVIVDNNWVPQYGGANQGDVVLVGETYTLSAKLEDATPDPANLLFGKAGFGYKNAKLTLKVEGDVLSITFVSGEEYDRTALPDTYQLVGACTNNWNLADAIQFEEVDGVLTAIVPDLSGTFKIVKNRAWDEQWATNRETNAGLTLGVPYVMGAKNESGDPANLSLANPFGSYTNAVLTLKKEDNGDMVLTLVSGEFQLMQADWHIPGEFLGWNCNAEQRFEKIDDNTYELLAFEFGNRFKVVYGTWAVEFGAPTADAVWEINKEYTLALKGPDFNAIDNKHIFEDCIITLVVDYENVEVKLTISSETLPSAVEDVVVPNTTTKVIENGQIYIIRNGVRYNALGGVVK